MKKISPILLCLPFLVGCKTSYNFHPYEGEKIVLDYCEDGDLIQVDADQLYEDVITNHKSTIYLFGLSSCSACNNVKNNLKTYATGYHCNLYWIEMRDVLQNSESIDKVKKATVGYYEWGENDAYPEVYFFLKGDVAFRCGETDVTTFISNYVEVDSNH